MDDVIIVITPLEVTFCVRNFGNKEMPIVEKNSDKEI